MNGFRIPVRQVLLLLGFVCFSVIAAPGGARADEQMAFPKPVQTYLDAAKDQMVYDPGKALSAAKSAEMAAGKLPESSETRLVALATARWLRSEAYIRTGEEAKARSLVERTLSQVVRIGRPMKVHGDLLLTLASLQISHNEPAQALANCHDAFRVFEKIDDKRSQSRALQMIATLYEYANDNRQAEKYYRQAGDVYKGTHL